MTNKYNPKNETIKAKYFDFLKEAKHRSDSTINATAKAMLRYEEFHNFEDLEKLTSDKAKDFKNFLMKTKSKSGRLLSKSTILHTINPLKDFFTWLHLEKNFKKRIKTNDISYFNLSPKEQKEARAVDNKPVPTIEIIKHTIESINIENEIDHRDKALIAFMLLTGVRDGAIITLKIGDVDLGRKLLKQYPINDVKTKNGKHIDTYFFPVGDEIEQIVVDWIKYLLEVKHFTQQDPLFPKTGVGLDEENSFKNIGLSKSHWKSASPLTGIFHKRFNAAGHTYYNPHSFRKTIVRLGEQICRTPEEFKAWSQNIGHEDTLTTFNSYGYVDVHRQGDIILGLGKNNKEDPLQVIMARLDKMEKQKSY